MAFEVQEQILKYSSTLTSAKLYLLKQPQKGLTFAFCGIEFRGATPVLSLEIQGSILVENNHLRQSAIFMGIQGLCPD